MKTAVIKSGGKQYIVSENDKIKVEKIINAKDGDKIEFETLLIVDEDKADIGAPLAKSKVSAKIIRQGRSKKVTGVKYKPKTRNAKKYGHRQHFTEVEITKIS